MRTPRPPGAGITSRPLPELRSVFHQRGEVHEATLRVKVRWVTPLGEETVSMS